MSANKHLDEAAVMEAVRSGESYRVIGERFGTTKSTISRIALKHDYSAAAASRPKQVEKPKPAAVNNLPTDVPAWAALAGLASDYRDFARDLGDDHAARECRKLMAEVRRQTALDARFGRAA